MGQHEFVSPLGGLLRDRYRWNRISRTDFLDKGLDLVVRFDIVELHTARPVVGGDFRIADDEIIRHVPLAVTLCLAVHIKMLRPAAPNPRPKGHTWSTGRAS